MKPPSVPSSISSVLHKRHDVSRHAALHDANRLQRLARYASRLQHSMASYRDAFAAISAHIRHREDLLHQLNAYVAALDRDHSQLATNTTTAPLPATTNSPRSRLRPFFAPNPHASAWRSRASSRAIPTDDGPFGRAAESHIRALLIQARAQTRLAEREAHAESHSARVIAGARARLGTGVAGGPTWETPLMTLRVERAGAETLRDRLLEEAARVERLVGVR